MIDDSGVLARRIPVFVVAPPLLYCFGLLFGLEGRIPWAGAWLLYVALGGALLGLVLRVAAPRAAATVFHVAEIVVRYGLALMLAHYAINKLIPGQFLLYNRDFDLPLRDVPSRRLAWHFLGHSTLYNGFVAMVELTGSLLLLSRRTVVAGALLCSGALVNVVVVDMSFGIRGALPLASVMACAAIVLAIVHVDAQLIRSVLWRPPAAPVTGLTVAPAIWAVAVVAMLAYIIDRNLGSRRGLGRQVPATGRWEVVECSPSPRVAMCQSSRSTQAAFMNIEVGMWGQLVVGGARRSLSFTYPYPTEYLTVRIAADSNEAELVLDGTVRDADTAVVLRGRSTNIAAFDVRLRRTRRAPWPPVRAY